MRMQTLNNHNQRRHALRVGTNLVNTSSSSESGVISEFVYHESHPALSQILLPVLHHLGSQSRWLLWLTPQQKLSRNWLVHSGLPVEKIVQLSQIQPTSTVDAMEKALQTGNYSVVLGWLPDLTDIDRERLRLAAEIGKAYGFIMKPLIDPIPRDGHLPSIKIHSSLYH
ncbi:SOS-induced cell division inhibitor SulA [Edaphovirga cremea]|uniref:SOS-induced cell division inhibitor SulA n=1 Tax=Edaphovirga cremea TaxID=2267246 RepID=UPI000DEEDB43|nr:SOS-induced cell division inhibitor SulA [Edaphovirga cremea]